MPNVIRLLRFVDQPRVEPGSPHAFLIAALLVALATVLRVALLPWVDGLPYVLFFLSVIAVGFLCGSAAALAAALLSVIAAWLFILPWDGSDLALQQTRFFSIGALTVTAIIAVMRAAGAEVRRSHEILRISEAQFRSLLESAPDAMVIADADRRIILVNAAAERLFGHSRAKLAGRPIATLIAEAERDLYEAELAAFMIAAPVVPPRRTIDLRGVRRDGTEFPLELSFGALKTETDLLTCNAIRDTTARHALEDKLRQASKAKSEFLASMSHELRTPLNAIIGFSEMIRDGAIGPLDSRYRGYGEDIAASGRHLQAIINDLLDIAKVESGRLELRDELVSIEETLDACRRMVAGMAEPAKVALDIEIRGTLPKLRSDSVRFQQILLNIMSNAVKFTPPGGRVSVTAGLEAAGVVIAVADTGIGMKEEDIPIALEPFRQIDGVMSRRFDGTGLGLPLAKALVELHGGRLEIESAPGNGTTVRIRLPLQRVATAAA